MSDEQEAEVADEEVEEEETDAGEGLQEGDFIRLAYTARSTDDDQLVDTTDAEVAEEEGVDQEDREFEPRTLVLGAGHIFEGVEEDIYGKEVGDSGSVTVPAAEAFGEYDQNQVRTVSADKIPEDNRYPGAHVDVDGQHGHVETIIGGRARVDFNHPLAGKDIEYEYEIVGEVEDTLEQASGLLSMYFDVPDLEMHIETDEVEEENEDSETPEESLADGETVDGETETVEKETLYIESTPQLTMNQQWMFSKQQIGQDIIDRTGIDRIIVQDVIDGSGGMMGGMGGMMGGMGGDVDLEEAIEDADIDEDELVEELEAEAEAESETDESADAEAESDDE